MKKGPAYLDRRFSIFDNTKAIRDETKEQMNLDKGGIEGNAGVSGHLLPICSDVRIERKMFVFFWSKEQTGEGCPLPPSPEVNPPSNNL